MDRRLDDSSDSDGADGVTNIVYKEIFQGLQDTKVSILLVWLVCYFWNVMFSITDIITIIAGKEANVV